MTIRKNQGICCYTSLQAYRHFSVATTGGLHPRPRLLFSEDVEPDVQNCRPGKVTPTIRSPTGRQSDLHLETGYVIPLSSSHHIPDTCGRCSCRRCRDHPEILSPVSWDITTDLLWALQELTEGHAGL